MWIVDAFQDVVLNTVIVVGETAGMSKQELKSQKNPITDL